MVKLNNLSGNIIEVMKSLSKNDGLVRLLAHDEKNPFLGSLRATKENIMNPTNKDCKIFPYPFDPEATTEDSSFIRVYYNTGEFDNSEVIQETELFIDIVVAKSLWLCNDGQRSLIRPYEIMDRVVDTIGKRGFSSIKLEINGWQHLAVNSKFDAIRIYSNYWKIET